MKTKITGALFLLLTLIVVSCKKTASTPAPQYYSDYQFKIISTDINDDTVSETQIWDFALNAQAPTVTRQTVQPTDDGGGNDCNGDNGKTNPKCQPMPVTFDNVSFRRQGYDIYVSWVAGVEYDVKGYYIEASTDGGHTWTSIQTIAPHGQGVEYNTSFALWTQTFSK